MSRYTAARIDHQTLYAACTTPRLLEISNTDEVHKFIAELDKSEEEKAVLEKKGKEKRGQVIRDKHAKDREAVS